MYVKYPLANLNIMYHDKIRRFFKSKKLTQKEVGRILGYSPAMTGRYLNGTAGIGSDFLVSLLKNFPELDLNDVFAHEPNNEVYEVKELRAIYEKTTIFNDIEDLEIKLQLIKEKLSRTIQQERIIN